jgi:hypothetical protein
VTSHRAQHRLAILFAALAPVLVAGRAAWSQPAPGPVPPAPPSSAPAAPSQPSPEGAPAKPGEPDLDELLGLPSTKKPDAKRPAAADPTRTELDRKLVSPAEAAEEFVKAIELMGETAQRLEQSRDSGLATQRLQEDVIRRLDMVIRQAEQNRQRRQQQKQQKQQQQQQQASQKQQEQASQQRPQQQRSSDSREDAMPPARQAAELSPDIASRGQAWGALPQRVRDALIQGNADTYSTLYRKWTEAYYRKLAEEGKR